VHLLASNSDSLERSSFDKAHHDHCGLHGNDSTPQYLRSSFSRIYACDWTLLLGLEEPQTLAYAGPASFDYG
jgi:hypothetical protein